MTDHEQRVQMTTSERSLDEVGAGLAVWLGRRVGPAVSVTGVRRPESGGLSSASVLFDAHWDGGGGSFVARMAPEVGAYPVFPAYDLEMQYSVIELAGRRGVPVPELVGIETDPQPLGVPFFVMTRVEGRVPSDNPPYVFLGWLFDATAAERAALTRNTVEVLARIHAIDPAEVPPVLRGEGSALRRHVESQRAYYRWALADDGFEIPVIERGFAWLEQHWPHEGETVLNWGDARPGNVIYNGVVPVAVLDWEMAALAPRELDLGWMIFIHRFFQDIATGLAGVAGLPDFQRRGEIVELYIEFAGHDVSDLDFYLVYAAIRHAIVMARIKRRMIHFGEDTVPADPDDYVMHRAALDAMLAGTYGWE
jgi:aminoglycoside phosphotransferase (APT) family kinase protein